MEVEALTRARRAEIVTPPESDPVLAERLKAEIERSGPISFARFMEVALGDPERGYYSTTTDRPTRAGDFLTAPELHPIFGATLGRAIEQVWGALGAPHPFQLVEFGAGSGRLALDILGSLRDRHSAVLEALRYRAIEILPDREAAIRARLAAEGFGQQLVTPRADPPNGRPEATMGIALANEFLDALPVHLVEQRDDGLVEIFVAWSAATGRFAELAGPPSSPELGARLADEGIVLEPGQRAEVCLELDRWAEQLTESVTRGVALVIDYGGEATSLYGEAHRRGTLLAYAGHRVHEEVLAGVGRQDITAHVDFTAATAAAERRGWLKVGLRTQASFLVAAGLQDELESRRSDPAATTEEYLELRSAVGRLLDPRALGGFRVLALERGTSTEKGGSPVAAWWAAAAPVR